MKNKLQYIILLVVALPAFAQEQRQAITGKVVSESYFLQEGILVVNLRAEKETKTNSLGVFSIAAKKGDTLVIADTGIETVKVVVTDEHIKKIQSIKVKVKDVYELEEVVVEKDNSLTSEALGLVPKGQKIYTPAERKLYTAGDFKPIHLFAIIGGGMPLDPVFNAINGRTKMLKKAVEVERKEFALEEMNGMFTTEEIISEFNIPEAYVDGFLFYCVEDEDFASAIRVKNGTMAKFMMAGLANKYLEVITEDINQPAEDE